MANSQKRELTEQKIILKVADSVEEVSPDLVLPPAGSAPSQQEAAMVTARPPAFKPTELEEYKSHLDEQSVVELLTNPDSDGFLTTIDELSPDEIGRILHTLNERNSWYARCFRQLTTVPDERRDALSIIVWWESRRIAFNLLVGLAGLPTLVILAFVMSASQDWIMQGVIAYGIAANVCYTAGCVSELVARRWWAEKAKHFGPILLTVGLAFSFFMTLLATVYIPLVLRSDPGVITMEKASRRIEWRNGVVQVQNQDGTGYVRRPGIARSFTEHHWGPDPQDNYTVFRNAAGVCSIERPPHGLIRKAVSN